MNANDIVIVAAKRTALGAFLGSLSPFSATELGASVVRALIEQVNVPNIQIDEVLMGCVLPAGLGQAPARQATLKAGLPNCVRSTTINKVCGSAMQATMLGCDLIKAQSANIVIAGGMESMSNAPYLLPKARSGLRMGHSPILDHMFFDGLENAEDNKLMGEFAELCATQYAFSRQAQDDYAIESVTRAKKAIESGLFRSEIVPLSYEHKGQQQIIDIDEIPNKVKIEKIATLKPAFKSENGTVTAANASSISDGAAAMLLMRYSDAQNLNIKPLAKVIAYTNHAQAPQDFTTAPVQAIKKLQQKTGWAEADIDLYEINEAFAVVAMAAIKELELDPAKVNIHGGACALGHPIGATGARLIVTLIHALIQHDLKKGVASLCIGGGEATAIAIERCA